MIDVGIACSVATWSGEIAEREPGAFVLGDESCRIAPVFRFELENRNPSRIATANLNRVAFRKIGLDRDSAALTIG
jgi:hypothetical protein